MSEENTDNNLENKKFRFVPEVTLGNVLQLLSLAAAVVALWVSLDKRLSAVEVAETYSVNERIDMKHNLQTLTDNQATMARTVDRISILFEQHAKQDMRGGDKTP